LQTQQQHKLYITKICIVQEALRSSFLLPHLNLPDALAVVFLPSVMAKAGAELCDFASIGESVAILGLAWATPTAGGMQIMQNDLLSLSMELLHK
jgi:hypothetical protein